MSPKLTKGMLKFLEHRPYHNTDAAAARAAGLTPGTVAQYKFDKNEEKRVLFLEAYEKAKTAMAPAPMNPELDLVVREELRPLALERYRELLNRRVGPDTTATEMRVVRDASKDVLESTGDMNRGERVTDVAVVLQQFIGNSRPQWQGQRPTTIEVLPEAE